MWCVELFNHWGVGDGESSNGLMMVLLKDQRRLESVMGLGLEEVRLRRWSYRLILFRPIECSRCHALCRTPVSALTCSVLAYAMSLLFPERACRCFRPRFLRMCSGR